MIPGGMPSGVPPSVYLSPVDAHNQQYMSRSMTMIPEGMPTGVPASVYRTPMDALNHQQVNWLEQQGPVTWDFQNNRIRFGEEGKWIALHSPKQCDRLKQ